MQIETFEIEEVNSSEAAQMAADSTAIELIEKLGLNGQKKLTNTETATRQTFKRMTLLEIEVYTILFPERDKLADFATEIIPVRVLETADKAIQLGQFYKLEVWHSRTRKDDPLLIAYTGTPSPQTWDSNYHHDTGRFLLARWGDALLPFSDLVSEAKKAWIATRAQALKKKKRDVEFEIENLQSDADAGFISGNLPA